MTSIYIFGQSKQNITATGLPQKIKYQVNINIINLIITLIITLGVQVLVAAFPLGTDEFFNRLSNDPLMFSLRMLITLFLQSVYSIIIMIILFKLTDLSPNAVNNIGLVTQIILSVLFSLFIAEKMISLVNDFSISDTIITILISIIISTISGIFFAPYNIISKKIPITNKSTVTKPSLSTIPEANEEDEDEE